MRELLGLGPAYYFSIAPAADAAAPTKYDAMWRALFDGERGFWGEFGPTTVERAGSKKAPVRAAVVSATRVRQGT